MYETRCASFERTGMPCSPWQSCSYPCHKAFGLLPSFRGVLPAVLCETRGVCQGDNNAACDINFDFLFARRLSSDTAGSGCRGQESYLSTRVCSPPRVGTQLVPRRVLLIQLCVLHLSRLLVCRSGNEAANSAYSPSLRLIRI